MSTNEEVVDLRDRTVASQKQETCSKHGSRLVACEMTGAGPFYACPDCELEELEAVDAFFKEDKNVT